MSEIHEKLTQNWEIYATENARYEEKGIKVARVRARKALSEIAKLAKERRKELIEAAEGSEE